MFFASVTVSILLALVLLTSGVMKVRRAPAVVANLARVGIPERVIPGLGALEIAATLGLLIGLLWWPIGLAAAIGSVAYFIGAIVTHLRARQRHRSRGRNARRLRHRPGALAPRPLTRPATAPEQKDAHNRRRSSDHDHPTIDVGRRDP